MRRKAAEAQRSHESRAFQTLMWGAAKEAGEHPLAHLGYDPTREELQSATALMAAISQVGGDGGALAALASMRAEQAAAAGAELALRSPSSAPPLHPIALKAWVATRRETQAEAVAGTLSALAVSRAQGGSEERENASARRAAREAMRAARLARDRETVASTLEQEALAREEREARAAAVREAARVEHEARIAAELEAMQRLSLRVAPLRAAEEELTERVQRAALSQGRAFATLEASVTFPPLPALNKLPRDALALASAAASTLGGSAGEHALLATLGSRRAAGAHNPLGLSSPTSVASSRAALGTTGTALLSSPRVAEATVGVRSAQASALASTLGHSKTARGATGVPTSPFALTGGGSMLSASTGAWGSESGFSATLPHPGGAALPSTALRGGLSASSSSTTSASSRLLLPVGLWHTGTPAAAQAPLSPSLRLPSALGALGGSSGASDGGGVAAARVEVALPPQGMRSPQVSTLRATTVSPDVLSSARAAAQSSASRGGMGGAGSARSPKGSVFAIIEEHQAFGVGAR
jgi:hypothetical protein